MRIRILRLGATLLAVTSPVPVAGQQNPFATPAACEESFRIVDAMPPADPDRTAALSRLRFCGPQGGAALASELRSLHSRTDRLATARISTEVARIRDAQVLQAALDLAADRSATTEARIAAFRIFVEYDDPNSRTTFDYFLSPRPVAKWYTSETVSLREGEPLPTGWRDTVRTVLTDIMEDPLESEVMQRAARRAMP